MVDNGSGDGSMAAVSPGLPGFDGSCRAATWATARRPTGVRQPPRLTSCWCATPISSFTPGTVAVAGRPSSTDDPGAGGRRAPLIRMPDGDRYPSARPSRRSSTPPATASWACSARQPVHPQLPAARLGSPPRRPTGRLGVGCLLSRSPIGLRGRRRVRPGYFMYAEDVDLCWRPAGAAGGWLRAGRRGVHIQGCLDRPSSLPDDRRAPPVPPAIRRGGRPGVDDDRRCRSATVAGAAPPWPASSPARALTSPGAVDQGASTVRPRRPRGRGVSQTVGGQPPWPTTQQENGWRGAHRWRTDLSRADAHQLVASLVVIAWVPPVGFSRYQRPQHADVGRSPRRAVDHWHAALGFDICGTSSPISRPSQQSTTGLTTDGDWRRDRHPPEEQLGGGQNATLGMFVSSTRASNCSTPRCSIRGSPPDQREVCPTGTPEAGKQGVVTAEDWPNFKVDDRYRSDDGDPQRLKFAQRAADHHGLRARRTPTSRAAGVDHHQPDHRRLRRFDHYDHRTDAPPPRYRPLRPRRRRPPRRRPLPRPPTTTAPTTTTPPRRHHDHPPTTTTATSGTKK